MSLRVCTEADCPRLIPSTARDGRCDQHRRERDRARGSSTARGYGYAHQQERKQWEPAVKAGTVRCRRCKQLIAPDDEWDLGHPDADCLDPKAPEHASLCNRATAGRRTGGGG